MRSEEDMPAMTVRLMLQHVKSLRGPFAQSHELHFTVPSPSMNASDSFVRHAGVTMTIVDDALAAKLRPGTVYTVDFNEPEVIGG